jgi:hypothetical protein
LAVRVVRLRHHIQYTYSYGTVHLHFYDCQLLPGSDPRDLRQGFQWVPGHSLGHYNFPEPNQPVLEMLQAESIDAAPAAPE